MRSSDDLSTRARIRDAALERFGAEGVEKATLRAIASDAGVSAPLVVHHFGSKAGLVRACDDYLFELVGEKLELTEQQAPPLSRMLDLMHRSRPVQRYVAGVVRRGTDSGRRMFALVVDATEDWLRAAEERGEVRPATDRRARAAMIAVQSLGMLVFSEALAAAYGAEAFGDDVQLRSSRAFIEMYTDGVFADDRWKRFAEGMDQGE